MSSQTMSAARRAFGALQGQLYPVRGQRGRVLGALVTVVRVSSSGNIVWVRFLSTKRSYQKRKRRLGLPQHRKGLHRFERRLGSYAGRPYGHYVANNNSELVF